MLMKKDCSWGTPIKIISDFKPKKKTLKFASKT